MSETAYASGVIVVVHKDGRTEVRLPDQPEPVFLEPGEIARFRFSVGTAWTVDRYDD